MVDPSSKQKARKETRKSIAEIKRANRKSISEGQNEATTLVPLDQLEASQEMTTAALRAKQKALDKAKRKKKSVDGENSDKEEESMTLQEEREARKLAEEQLEDALLEVERMQVVGFPPDPRPAGCLHVAPWAPISRRNRNLGVAQHTTTSYARTGLRF
ncbi:hypothetical protein CYMTET_16556 [Cymbomonas tetramitiformis]|uniref:Uncharacterized protein n=1 Tax=Cymbomonas tetramitiformis TaxID=36881 RepID=A0AAE0GD58_9CHLO|nr:hypothetical protein CYMTET_16556 [Cymbomonas tetramitiformis]